MAKKKDEGKPKIKKLTPAQLQKLKGGVAGGWEVTCGMSCSYYNKGGLWSRSGGGDKTGK